MRYKMVFDTETTDLNQCFCYNVGYLILDSMTQETVLEKNFVVEQIWHNLPLFESAYYKDKRPLYVQMMKQRIITMDKWGYIMREMRKDMREYSIVDAYAYNSPFDDKVFDYNCDWFKTINPFETVATHDIWGYASEFITCKPEYKEFCETNSLFTDTGNYKGSAESVYRFLIGDNSFNEAHIGLQDCQIERDILLACINLGAEWDKDYNVQKVLKRPVTHPFTIKVNNKVIYTSTYTKKYIKNDVYNFTEH